MGRGRNALVKACRCEALEPRRLLAEFVASSLADTIEISYDPAAHVTHVVINGVDNTTADSVIRIQALPGSDQIFINSMRPYGFIQVFGWEGDDLLAINNLDELTEQVVDYVGGIGFDAAVLDESADSGGGTIDVHIAADRISRSDTSRAPFNYSAVEWLSYKDGNGSNRIQFHGGAFDELSIDGGGGADIISSTGSLLVSSAIASETMSIRGGAGIDVLALSDRHRQGGARYEITSTTFQAFTSGVESGLVNYDGIETFELLTSDGTDLVELRRKLPSTAMRIDAGTGGDTFIVGGGDVDSSGITSSTTTLLGGAGNDRIEFDDRLDEHNLVSADTFSFHFQQVIKDGTTITYGGFESQKLITSGVKNPALTSAYNVRINAIDIPTEVQGGAGVRNNAVDVGNVGTNLSQIFAPITLAFADSPVVVSVYDQNTLGARGWEFSATQMTLPVVVNYFGVEDLHVHAGSGNDTLNVSGTPAGMNVFFNGGNGDEIMSLGSNGGAFATLAGRVFANGGNGVDRLRFTNGTAGGFTDGVLLSGGFRANGGTNHLYSAVEFVDIFVNDAGSSIDVRSGFGSIFGGAGNDSVTVGGGDFNDSIFNSVFVRGEGGVDRVVIDDTNDVNPAGTTVSYRFDVAFGLDRVLKDTGGFIQGVSCMGVEHREFNGSNDANQINVLDTQGDLRINSNGGNDAIAVTDATGLVSVYTGSGGDQLIINTDSGSAGDGPATVRLDRSDDLNHLEVRPGGTLDVGDNDLLIDYTGASPYAAIKGYVVTGRNTGTGGIVSTRTAANDTVLAVVDNAQFGRTAFNGIPIDSTTIIGKYTYFGDANLDGMVTGDDYLAIDSNLGVSPGTRQWFHGDFNFDGAVTGDDYLAIDANLGKGTADPLAWAEERDEMIALHADRYGGKSYVKQVEAMIAGTTKLKPSRR